MAGIDANGFTPKTLAEVKAELEDALKASFGASIDLSPQSNFGQVVGVMAERFSDLWQLGQAIWASGQPDSALGLSLDEVCALTGTVRLPATFSKVTLTATGTTGTVLAAGRTASVAVVGTRFDTTAPGTIAAATAWQVNHAYALGARVKNGAGPSRVYQCVTAGTSAGAGGPAGTGADITDNTAHWRYLGDGDGAVDIASRCEVTGPRVAASSTLTVIQTPVAGWSSVNNVLDAALGADLEADALLRIRREAEIRSEGKAALDAVRAALLEVSGVTASTVFENVTDATNSDGLPPHSVECLALGGVDQDIANAVFAAVAAGIATYGVSSATVVDSEGFSHTVKFTRPTLKLIYVVVDVLADAALWPSDGDAQVKAAIVAFGNLQKIGKDVVASSVAAQVFDVVGALDATAKIGLAPAPATSATIPISLRELAVHDTGRITVNVTYGTP